MSLYEQFMNKCRAIMNMPELKKRIIFTLLMFLVARIGTLIPVPGVDPEKMSALFNNSSILGFVNMFSGGALKRASIFALGVMPYINASIIMSLITVIIPKLDELQKEGDTGRSKITQWTRYLTIVIGVIQAFGVTLLLQREGVVITPGIMFTMITIVTVTAGTVFLMWIGEQISIKGIGNGISLMIFLNIISRMPTATVQTIQKMEGDKFLIPVLVVVAAAALLTVSGIVIFQLSQRRIPIHYAGRGFSGNENSASSSFLPIKLNSAGVMPVIFASVIMMIPSLLVKLLPSSMPGYALLTNMLTRNHPVYLIIYAILVIFFSFFYTAMMFDPEKIADNLKQSGGTIPGIRPGNETVEYLEKVIMRITWGGAIFLAVIAVLPAFIFTAANLPVFFGGTGILIVVGVALDTIQRINAHLITKEYKGFI